MRLLLLTLAWGLLSAFSCTVQRPFDAPDIDIPEPSKRELELRQQRFQAGEKWLGDPREVAHNTLLEFIPNVPWKYQGYRPEIYELKNDKPEWGPYVVRGYATRDMVRRYRVKVRSYQNIWYPVQISHYAIVELPHPALDDEE